MASRNDILAEMRLAPRWRLRTSAGLKDAAAFAVIDDSTTSAASFGASATIESAVQVRNVRETEDDGDARRERIGALTWPAFAADVAACTACGLCRTRNKSVPGVGDVNAEWLFVGEAPGGEEDAKGEPFVGQAGRLLDNMLAALGLARGTNVYIANVQKCRPPGNRTPEPAEIEACRPYLDRQIALIRPKLIVALGKSAAH
ncbi:MAG: uracil-DNA glycosylase, partial [Burkholderiaceae bacterium]